MNDTLPNVPKLGEFNKAKNSLFIVPQKIEFFLIFYTDENRFIIMFIT